MLFDTPMQDRFCSFIHNPQTGGYDRKWLQYADGTFEPVRRVGSIARKWQPERTNFTWWVTHKPACWRPSEEGFDFAWNHSFGEENKPADWGDMPDEERAAGSAPYFMQLERNAVGRIESRTERINGRRESWKFEYDEDGRLTSVIGDTGWCEDFEYDKHGRRSADYAVGREPFMRSYKYGPDNRLLEVEGVRYEHDEQGFRSARIAPAGATRFRYSDDYRLLGVDLADGRRVTYAHDEDGQRSQKLINGVPVEAYDWLDFVRLGGFFDGRNEYVFHYAADTRLPASVTIGDTEYSLEYDQIGSLKAVVTSTGNVVKAIQYGPFGNILWDSNPGLRLPLGFAGGLWDPDAGLVRFGWRDYDPDTGRWTAPDPIGDAGGDPDWYGYCLDDPVNAYDPLGLSPLAALPLFMKGSVIASALAGGGSLLAGLTADGLGSVAGKNADAPLKATKGAAKGAGMATAVQGGILGTAAGGAALARAGAATAAAAPSLIRQGKNALAKGAEHAKTIGRAAQDWSKANPDKVDKAMRIGKDLVDPNQPPETRTGQVYTASKHFAGKLYEKFDKPKKYEKTNQQVPSDVWGR